MTTRTPIDEIPGPRALPFVGNAFDIDAHHPFESMMGMAREYGPIFRLTTPGGVRLIVSGASLVEEICDDARFDKVVSGGLANVRRTATSTGLFTAETDDPLWHRAHNILMKPFSLQSMRDYVPMMLDIANQLADKWERLNPDEDVDVPADMTRLTLDTIALCGFGYRFNSFYRDTQHPFVAAMIRTLTESQARARRLPIQTRLRIHAQRQLEEDQAFMNDLVDKLIAERRAEGDAGKKDDLLGQMINGVDKQTGERLPDDNIRAQCITFLIAGHETTSGLLSFAIYYLLKNPDLLARARAEVDEVFGTSAEPTYEQIHKLTYVRQVLGEALRLWPTAPGFTRTPFEETVIGDRYLVEHGLPLTVLTPMLHRDPSVWGDDAEEFDPEHMAPERVAALSPNVYKPFGTGQRACIGRQFAMQEAALVLGMLVQRFDFIDHLNYQLKTKTTLTIKPDDMHIQVRPRPGFRLDRPGSAAAPAKAVSAAPAARAALAPDAHKTPLLVAYGSNLGTAEGIATRIGREGTERGFAVTLSALDDLTDALPTPGAAVIVTSSYNGTPPDNAGKFCDWLRGSGAAKDAAAGLSYTVFGCGNTEWAATYQAVPKLIDTELAAHGATRLHPRGEGDANGDFDAQYRSWHHGLWADLAANAGLPESAAEPATAGPRLSISLVNRQLTNPVIMSYQAQPALVRVNRELHAPNGGRSTKHIEVALPEGVDFRAGDHLGVLPRNHIDLIRRVMQRFTLDGGMYATIIPNAGEHTHLPIDEPAPLLGILASCVELQDVATRAGIEVLAHYTEDPAQRAELESLAGDDEASQTRYQERVFTPRRSLLDLLEEFPSCAVPFDVYLDLLPPLRPRYYSISSSPLTDAKVASITTGVLRAPVRGGGEDTFSGVCSNYLAGSPGGSTVFVFVRRPTIEFRPPDNPHTPMIMVGAGTGLAPFRGFLQERAALRAQGVPIAESLLFFGCRDANRDFLYADELREYDHEGVAKLHVVFSRAPVDGRKYVQHEIAASGDEVWRLLQDGAAVFVCGNAATMAPGVRAAFTTLFAEKTGAGEADAQAWLAGLRAANRYVEDIWGGG
ncbi:bifunctional cytochrome P450/NADPH--P450 reductase [Amycolatopsis sp. NPDC051903]|uniref:bifunctional cytochrome P450/NADPH--P450 reductase n=1 Tax=Amycolatopsis sp. NPDC051903 TaxID=3363936 RepID=UPI0037BC8381